MGAGRLPRGDVSEIGLCARCRWARQLHSAKGGVFWRCGRSSHEASYPAYPRLPVNSCRGFEADSTTRPPR